MFGLKLGLGLNGASGASGGGGGGGDSDEATLVTNAGLLLWMRPDTDPIYSTDAETDPIDKEADGGTVKRYTPALKPADLTHFVDAAGATPAYRNAANGINGNPTIHFNLSAGHALVDVGSSFRHDDLLAADSALLVLTGKLLAVDGVSASFIAAGIADGQAVRFLLQTAGTIALQFEVSAGDVSLTVTPDENDLFSIVAWLHDGTIDWWANGVKQTAVASFPGLINLASSADWVVRCGLNSNNWHMLRHGAGKAEGAEEVDIVALVGHLETLLGR